MDLIIIPSQGNMDLSAGQAVNHGPLGAFLGDIPQQVQGLLMVESPLKFAQPSLDGIISGAVPHPGAARSRDQEIGGLMPPGDLMLTRPSPRSEGV
ncbi:MAG: hypothetical protein MUO62_12490 [Anaerolineales bacterium]|nr:hypothetical protein [Anaerolineales bacterium]